jgi:hypothetical protein
MPEPPSNPEDGTKKPVPVPAAKRGEPRRSPRYPFTATAEVTDLESDSKFLARTGDLALGGCYVDTMNPLPAGTRVKIRLTKDQKTFEASGTVRHAQAGMGMGIAFAEMNSEHSLLLQSWLAELSGKPAPAAPAITTAGAEQQVTRSDHLILAQLIRILVKKGILTEVEEAALLRQLRS